MAPKHGLSQSSVAEEQLAKRAKSSETPVSRSATPADTTAKVEYEVKYPIMNSKKKLPRKEQDLVDYAEFQESPFLAKGALKEKELDQHYTVVPSKEWAAMKKYNNFIIQGEVYKNNQFVFVRGEGTPKDKAQEENLKDFWVARILQVRAKNAQHVYALVAWMYWPEELPPPVTNAKDLFSKTTGGKRTYHGNFELIASNYMEVLDVLSFAGKADVHHWLEEDDNLSSKLYWRQTFCRGTQALSKLRQHCVCGGHFNPDVSMYICDNTTCKVWLHKECIVDDVLTKTYNKLVNGDDSSANGSTNGKKPKSRKPYKGLFQAEIVEEGEMPPTIRITDLRGGANPKTWMEPIYCPKCNTALQ